MASPAPMKRPPKRRAPVMRPDRSISWRHWYITLLGLKVQEASALLAEIQKGLSFDAWEHFILNTSLRKEEAIGMVQITARTLSRRKGEGRLHPDESDRLIRAARIFAQAAELFEGDVESARKWLTTPQPGLGGAPPVEYAATEVGAREVEALLGRLEHGIPS